MADEATETRDSLAIALAFVENPQMSHWRLEETAKKYRSQANRVQRALEIRGYTIVPTEGR